MIFVNKKKKQKKIIYKKRTFLGAWTTLHTDIQKLAQKHEELAQNINSQVSAMEKFHKDKGVEKKNLNKVGTKLTKDMHDSISNVKRSKDTYYKDHKTADSNESSYNTKKSDGKTKQKDVDKAHKTATETRDKAAASDANYQKLLEIHNGNQTQFYKSLMPQLLSDYQKNEEERTKFFKTTMKAYMESFNQLGPAYSSVTSSLGSSLDAIDSKKDVSEFINIHKASAVRVADPALYEPYGSEGGAGVNLGASTKKGSSVGAQFGTNSTVTSNPPSTNNTTTSTSGTPGTNSVSTGPKVGISETPVVVGHPKKTALPTFGLTASDDNLPVAEKRKKLEVQLAQVKEMIKTEVKSKKGLDKLTVFYKDDPAAAATAQKESDEQGARINTLKSEKKKILAHLEEMGEGGERPNEGSEDGEEEGEFVEVSAKALFDYNAANETELAFKAGDILTITEQDTSGWWYAELNGKQGFIPNNYIEVLKDK